jgi:hypothetical protein
MAWPGRLPRSSRHSASKSKSQQATKQTLVLVNHSGRPSAGHCRRMTPSTSINRGRITIGRCVNGRIRSRQLSDTERPRTARQVNDPMVVGLVIWPWSALLAIRAPGNSPLFRGPQKKVHMRSPADTGTILHSCSSANSLCKYFESVICMGPFCKSPVVQ